MKGDSDGAGRNSLGQDIWLLERRGVRKKPAFPAVPQGPAGVARVPGNSEDLWI